MSSVTFATRRLAPFIGMTPAAFDDGRLRSEEILLTDGVPADMPVLAGLISLTPSTPNSHTTILSRSFGVAEGFRPLNPAKNSFSLDFEFKKDARLGLVRYYFREAA